MTKFYLTNTNSGMSATGTTGINSLISWGTNNINANNATATGVNKALSTAAGASQASVSWNTWADGSNPQNAFWGRWSILGSNLSTLSIAANTWTIALANSETNAAANAFTALVIYKASSTNANRAVAFEGITQGTEYATTETGIVFTVSGSAITLASTSEYLCFEWAMNGTQSMSTTYNISAYWNGTTDPVNATATSNAACYIETPQSLVGATATTEQRSFRFRTDDTATLNAAFT